VSDRHLITVEKLVTTAPSAFITGERETRLVGAKGTENVDVTGGGGRRMSTEQFAVGDRTAT